MLWVGKIALVQVLWCPRILAWSFSVRALLVCPLVVIAVVALVFTRLLVIVLWVFVVSGECELCVVIQLHIAEVVFGDNLVLQCADVNEGGGVSCCCRCGSR